MAHNEKVIELMRNVSREVSSSLDMANVSEVVLRYAKDFLGADYCALFLEDSESKKLILVGAEGFKRGHLENLKILGSWERINNELLKKKKAVIVNDIFRDAKFKHKKLPFSGDCLALGAFLAVPLRKGEKIIGSLIVSNHKRRNVNFSEDDKKLLYTLVNQVQMSVINAKLFGDLKNLYVKTVSSLAQAIDARDPYTRGHSDRVSGYAVLIARELGCHEKFLENIRLAGILHDVGKIGIRDNVLLKETALDDTDMAKIRLHPLIGARIVKKVIRAQGVIKGIIEHHERIDGKGYPRGLKGDKISLEGKIVAVADTYDTITTGRPYKKAYSPKEAILEIVQHCGTQLDLKVVKAFQRSFSKHPELWREV